MTAASSRVILGLHVVGATLSAYVYFFVSYFNGASSTRWVSGAFGALSLVFSR